MGEVQKMALSSVTVFCGVPSLRAFHPVRETTAKRWLLDESQKRGIDRLLAAAAKGVWGLGVAGGGRATGLVWFVSSLFGRAQLMAFYASRTKKSPHKQRQLHKGASFYISNI